MLIPESADSVDGVDVEESKQQEDRKSSLFNRVDENLSYDYEEDEKAAVTNHSDTDRTPRADDDEPNNQARTKSDEVKINESAALEPYISKAEAANESNESNEANEKKAEQKPKRYNLEEDDDFVETSDLMHLEPKLRDAWIKMRKLDKILVRVCKREKQVKRETLALIEKNRAELELLRLTTDHKVSNMEAQNTAHCVALS